MSTIARSSAGRQTDWKGVCQSTTLIAHKSSLSRTGSAQGGYHTKNSSSHNRCRQAIRAQKHSFKYSSIQINRYAVDLFQIPPDLRLFGQLQNIMIPPLLGWKPGIWHDANGQELLIPRRVFVDGEICTITLKTIGSVSESGYFLMKILGLFFHR